MWAVYADNRFTRSWTFEFEGTRAECLQYLEYATGNQSCRLWDFKLVNPNNRPKNDPADHGD